MSNSEQAAVKPTARIDWRKLLVPSLFVMVLPTITALLVDRWLGTLPYITIGAIVICFPIATVWVIRVALQELDRVIAEVTPPEQEESAPATGAVFETPAEPGVQSTSSP